MGLCCGTLSSIDVMLKFKRPHYVSGIISALVHEIIVSPLLSPMTNWAGCPHLLPCLPPGPGASDLWPTYYIWPARPGQATAGVTERSQLLFCCSVTLISDNMWPPVLATSSSHMRHASPSPAMITIPWAPAPRAQCELWMLVTTVC